MPEEIITAVTDDKPNTTNITLTDVSALQAELAKVRSEAAAYRTKLKEQNEAKLKEQNDWQALAEARLKETIEAKAELDKLAPVATRSTQLEKIIKDQIKAQVAALPESFRGLVPEFDDPAKTLSWLNENSSKLVRPTPPSLDSGVTSSVLAASSLSNSELEIARKMNLTPEEYAKYKR
jgi:hypothetical protein